MPHHTPLIATIVAGLCLAFVFGALAQRLRLPPLAGYLLAGVLVGPFTPGYVADQSLAPELAEIGVILLMFGVGLHFSLKDLLAVKHIAVPGAIAQIAAATAMGWGMAWWLGWGHGAGLVFGLSLSVASTVVLLRALQEQRIVDTERGRIAVGWLIVEDLVMVLALVLLPAVAGLFQPAGGGEAAEAGASGASLAWALAMTLGKVIAFVALMLVVGRRVIPWMLERTAQSGSKELFRLAVLAVALGVAFGSALLFGVSFALGAFFAGMILGESELSHRAAEETVPLRDAFAVLFFVSIGMLLDPAILWREPLAVLATFLIIVVGKSVVAWLIVRAFGRPNDTALTISASLAQIGEFSFILAGLGVSLALLPPEGRDLILAGAILSILVNPFIFALLGRLEAQRERAAAPAAPGHDDARHTCQLARHTVLIGHGRVGRRVAEGLRAAHRPLVVIEDRLEEVEALRRDGIEALCGNGVTAGLLQDANIAQAERLVVAIPNVFEAGQAIEAARRLRPGLPVVARAHSDAEVKHLLAHGANHVLMGEQEIARGMLDWIAAPAPEAPAAGGQPAPLPA